MAGFSGVTEHSLQWHVGKRPSAWATRNPNLKVGKVTDRDTYFEVEILTKEDSFADKLAVDKNTGWMRSIY